MKVTEHFARAKKTLFSFEIMPPLKGVSIQSLFDSISPLMEFNPPFIDVTYHREEYVYKKRENNLLERRSVRKRPSTVGICAAIQNKYHIDAVPHIICGGFSKEDTENALIDLQFLGINNLLLLRGDPIKTEKNFVQEPDGHNYASELIQQVKNLNTGIYLDNELQNHFPTNFCIGVAGYPEKHFESPNLKSCLKYLKYKVDLGADYIVTQMFFDNKNFFDFVNACKTEGIHVPIVPGLKPITAKNQITTIPKTFYIDIPDLLAEEIRKCTNDIQANEVGIEWAVQQSKELITFGVPCIHFFTMGKSNAIKRVVERIM
ncbi:MAG: methylenetetrahydrofolate reductase [NAD(P)H] [Bacteroidota bacterium]